MGKYQDSVGISLDLTIVEGSCRWKLSSGNLYTFIRPNQEQLGKMQLYIGPWRESNLRSWDSGAAL